MVAKLDGVKLHELITAVSNLKDIEQINAVQEAINTAQGRRRREMGSVFDVEDTVWVVQKTKRSRGVIKKINFSRAKVFMEEGTYKGKTVSAPFTMLELRTE
jgi:hypothetical protein